MHPTPPERTGFVLTFPFPFPFPFPFSTTFSVGSARMAIEGLRGHSFTATLGAGPTRRPEVPRRNIGWLRSMVTGIAAPPACRVTLAACRSVRKGADRRREIPGGRFAMVSLACIRAAISESECFHSRSRPVLVTSGTLGRGTSCFLRFKLLLASRARARIRTATTMAAQTPTIPASRSGVVDAGTICQRESGGELPTRNVDCVHALGQR
jgi:hypothetical protein